MRPLPRLILDRNGAMAVEAALLLPILLTALLSTLEIGRIAWTQATLNYAVQEAARCAVVQKKGACASDTAIRTVAARRAAPVNVPATAFSVTGTSVRCVTARYGFRYILTALTTNGLTISAKACRA